MEVFRNWSASILWGFFVWFALGSAAVTYVVARDGPPEGASSEAAIGLCALFWLVTVGLGYAATRTPFVLAIVGKDHSLTVHLRHGLIKKRKVFGAASVHGAELVVSQDSEGSPYYVAQVTAGEQFHVAIAEGHTRSKCERVCERFNAACGSAHRARSVSVGGGGA